MNINEKGKCISNFKEIVGFIKSNFKGQLRYTDITNNTVNLIEKCIFEDKGNYIIFYNVDDGCAILFSIVLLDEFFVYSFGVGDNRRKYICFLDIINSKDGLIEFI